MTELRGAHYIIKSLGSLQETKESSQKIMNSFIRTYFEKHIFPYAESLGFFIIHEHNLTFENPIYSVTMLKKGEDGEKIYIRAMIDDDREEPEIILSYYKNICDTRPESLNIEDPENSFKNWMAKLNL